MVILRTICARRCSTLLATKFRYALLLVMETNTTLSGLEQLIGIE